MYSIKLWVCSAGIYVYYFGVEDTTVGSHDCHSSWRQSTPKTMQLVSIQRIILTAKALAYTSSYHPKTCRRININPTNSRSVLMMYICRSLLFYLSPLNNYDAWIANSNARIKLILIAN